MKRTSPLTLSIFTICVIGFSSSANAMDDAYRQELMDKAMNCISANAQKGLQWEDVCYTSDAPQASDSREFMVAKSLDQAIREHAEDAQGAKSVDTIVPEHQEYSDSQSKDLDTMIQEHGIANDANYQPAPQNMDSTRAEKPYVQYAQASREEYPAYEPSTRADFSPQASLNESRRPLNDRMQNQNKSEIGLEYMRYRYIEPVFDLEDTGNVYGVYASYTARPGKDDGLYDDIVDMYKAEGRFSYGQVDYKSAPSGEMSDIPDWSVEFRGLVGKDLPVFTDSRLTPYAGIGFRYLNDDSSGKTTTTGAGGYMRESRYFYIPVGLEFTTRLTDGWLVAPTLEYDIFISGKQISHLQDVNAGLPEIENDQNSGSGMRASLKFIKENPQVNFVIEPYVRYWHIEDSDSTTAAGSGFVVTGLEPENETTEYGVRLGAQF